MKSSKKVLAFALAAAMVVTAVPATNAQAASTAKLSAKKATVYSEGYKTVTVKTPKSWKSVKVTATSNKKSVAKVKKTAAKKIKVTGVKPGTAKVTVKVTYKTSTKKSAKTKTKKLTYTMKVAKASVALSGDSAVAVGSTTKLTTTKKASSRAKITYTSSDETIATVSEDGTVKGVKAGKATITAKLTIGKDTATATQEVEVKNYVLSTVAQNKLTELTATVAGDTKNLKATDFAIKSEATNVVYPVSKVTVDSKDASKVTLTLFSELKDAATYDVTLDGITKTFVASDGKVASIGLDNVTIPAATETEVKLVSKDANGVIVKEVSYPSSDSTYDFTIDTKGNGYTSGSKLYLNKVGDTAEATITYKTGKYDQNGKPEGNIGPNKVTITAVDQAVVNSFDARIDDTTKASFDKAKNTKKIAAKDLNKAVFFQIKDANGKEISSSEYAKYSVETSDKTVLMLATSSLGSKKVNLTALKSGTAYILIKKDNKVVGSIAIEIGAERAVATLELDKYSVTVSRSLSGDAKAVKATVKDQYGDNFAATLNVECLSTDVSGKVPADISGPNYYTYDNDKTVTFKNTAEKGNYVYKISYKKDGKEVVAKTVSVTVKEATNTTATAWRLDVANDNADIVVGKDVKDQTVTVSMIGMNDGTDVKRETTTKYVVKDKDGKVVYDDTAATVVSKGAFTRNDAGVLTFDALTTSTSSTSGSAITATKNIAAGKYDVTAVYQKDANTKVTMTTSFTIKDSQAAAGVEQKAETVDAAYDTVSAALGQALVITYGDKVYTDRSDVDNKTGLAANIVEYKVNDNVKGEVTSDSVKVNGTYFNVSKLTLKIEVSPNVYTNIDINVNAIKSITVK
ncbi:MAG: hypothetical protein EGS40_00445 [Agathobacter sp.]|nr:hypothetical protein [Agathobacter sp.]